MCAMAAKKLSVRLFGGFIVRYGDEILTFGKHANSKFGQLFQILMTRPGEDFCREEVIELIYGSGEAEGAGNGFQNVVSRLRKYLDDSPLPPGQYLIAAGGSIRFGGPVEIESDAWKFECLADDFERERDPSKKAGMCEKACGLFQGDFLPQLSREEWVVQRNQYYRQRYFKMLRYLLEYLKEKGDHVSIGRFVLRALELEPFGEWLSWRIDSLMAQGRRQDALKAYQAAVRQKEAMGDDLPGELCDRLAEIGNRLKRPPETKRKPSSRLWMEKLHQGACHCTLPGFVEQYQILKYSEKHRANPFVLLLCTIQNADGNPVDIRRNFERQGRELQEAFQTNLRTGDVYVRYNGSQYLLLCVGIEVENVPEIATRIDEDFRKRCFGHYITHYRLLDSVSML